MELPRYERLHLVAFVNMGLHLLLDGSRDRDVTTILDDAWRRVYGNNLPDELTTEALRGVFNIQYRSRYRARVPTPNTPRDLEIDWSVLKPIETERLQLEKPRHQAMVAELGNWNKIPLERFNFQWSQCLADRSNPLPSAHTILELSDLLAFEQLYKDKFGSVNGPRKLFCDVLGMPWHNDDGEIILDVSNDGPSVDWANIHESEAVQTPFETAYQRLLDHPFFLNNWEDKDTTSHTFKTAAVIIEKRRELLILQLLDNEELTPHHKERAELLLPRTLWKPHRAALRQIDVTNMNRARRYGTEMGYSSMNYYSEWYGAFQVEVEERALHCNEFDAERDEQGL